MRSPFPGIRPAAAFILALACATASGQVDLGTPPSVGTMRFAADVAVVPAANGVGAVEITYGITYDALRFVRHGDGFRSRFDVTAILYDSDGRQVTGDSWRKSVEVEEYEETSSRRSAVSEALRLEASPGRYSLKLELKSLDTRASGFIERMIEIPRVRPGELLIGTLLFEADEPAVDGQAPESVLNPGRIYGEEHPVARVRIPVYGSPGASYTLALSVLDDRANLKKSFLDTVVQVDDLTEHTREFPVLDLEVGVYVVRVEVDPLADGDKDRARARFRVITSPRSWGEDFDKMIAQISYVASREEVQKLVDAAVEDRDAAWAEFWAARDPDPLTEINEFKVGFLERLGYANTHFRSVVEGWQTDMGRVYIQFGEPDDVDSQPIGKMLHAWEIWYYYGEHTKYVFVDREGFGEFILVETSPI